MHKKIAIHCDGGSRGNPGPGALGVWFPELNKGYSEYLGHCTNNEAEYRAAIFGLKKARQLLGKEEAKKTDIEIRADSELMVKQMNHQYRVKEPGIVPLFIELWNLELDFNSVSFTHVFREQNKEADALVNEALDAQK